VEHLQNWTRIARPFFQSKNSQARWFGLPFIRDYTYRSTDIVPWTSATGNTALPIFLSCLGKLSLCYLTQDICPGLITRAPSSRRLVADDWSEEWLPRPVFASI
jgi:hypothetical protein